MDSSYLCETGSLQKVPASGAFNANAIHTAPAPSPSFDHCQELTLALSDSNHYPNLANHPRLPCKGLIKDGCLDLAEVCRLHLSLSFH